ncbi:MAG: c-type cytochrome [Hyphomicrobiales bacterium]
MKIDSSQIVLFVVFMVLGLISAWYFGDLGEKTTSGAISEPKLSVVQQQGRVLFTQNCAQCHGSSGSGTDQGPPLIHKIYEPSHHGDGSFIVAARSGVRAHHWKFGNMPPVNSVTDDDVSKITQYIRAVQRENGIH